LATKYVTSVIDRQTDGDRQTDRQTDRHTDRTDNGPIAYGEPFNKRSLKNKKQVY